MRRQIVIGMLLLLVLVFMAACGREKIPTATSPASEASKTVLPAGTVSPPPTVTSVAGYPQPGATLPYLPPEQTQVEVPYIPPEATATRKPISTVTITSATFTLGPTVTSTPTPTSDSGYPGPGEEYPTSTDETPSYPGPEGSTNTPSGVTKTSTPANVQATSTRTRAPTSTVGPTATPNLTPSPTEKPVRTEPPPPTQSASTIQVWHSWSSNELAGLSEMIYAFEQVYPQYKVELVYHPEAELRLQYETEVYYGRGPNLVIAPAEWGGSFYERGAVFDLTGIAEPGFLAAINPACLAGARYRGELIGLPLRIRAGMLLFRNTTLIPEAPATFSDLATAAQSATRGGRVGTYWDRGFLFSAAHLYGLGGNLEDEGGHPAFNSPAGFEWLEFLKSYSDIGATTFNSDIDLHLFKLDRVGFLIDGSWNLETISDTLGAENLSIDPWPAYGNTGHLSGFVQSDTMVLNPNLGGDERYHTLQLMGFLLAPEVQVILARRGLIPAVRQVPLDAAIQQAYPFLSAQMVAFAGGTPYPLTPRLEAYWTALERAMLAVFEGNLTPQGALQQAYEDVTP